MTKISRNFGGIWAILDGKLSEHLFSKIWEFWNSESFFAKMCCFVVAKVTNPLKTLDLVPGDTTVSTRDLTVAVAGRKVVDQSVIRSAVCADPTDPRSAVQFIQIRVDPRF